MKITTRCSNCSKTFKVDETNIGRKATCPACQTTFVIGAVIETPVIGTDPPSDDVSFEAVFSAPVASPNNVVIDKNPNPLPIFDDFSNGANGGESEEKVPPRLNKRVSKFKLDTGWLGHLRTTNVLLCLLLSLYAYDTWCRWTSEMWRDQLTAMALLDAEKAQLKEFESWRDVKSIAADETERFIKDQNLIITKLYKRIGDTRRSIRWFAGHY